SQADSTRPDENTPSDDCPHPGHKPSAAPPGPAPAIGPAPPSPEPSTARTTFPVPAPAFAPGTLSPNACHAGSAPKPSPSTPRGNLHDAAVRERRPDQRTVLVAACPVTETLSPRAPTPWRLALRGEKKPDRHATSVSACAAFSPTSRFRVPAAAAPAPGF